MGTRKKIAKQIIDRNHYIPLIKGIQETLGNERAEYVIYHQEAEGCTVTVAENKFQKLLTLIQLENIMNKLIKKRMLLRMRFYVR